MKWLPFVGAAIVIVLLAAFLIATQLSRQSGTVTLIVRDLDDTRTIQTYSLATNSLSVRTDVDPNSVTTISARTFELSDGSIVTLANSGVVRYQGGESGPISVLIASPVAPLLNTPLSVWRDADRIAWMNPADRSIQVFEKSARGAYLPIQLSEAFGASSLGFTDTGNVVVAGKIVGEQTELYALSLSTGDIVHIGTVDGLASVVPTP